VDKTGKEFEYLVRDIQVTMQRVYGLRPDQVVARPRHRIVGKQSGQLREVDVALFLDTEAGPLFYAIECRDRKARQDLLWIEQLATKRHDIGADHIAAVARDGFTKPAVRSAEANDIQLYRLSDRAAFNDEKTLGDLEVTTFKPTVSLRTFRWSHRGMVLNLNDQIPRLTEEEATILSQDFEGQNWYDTVEKKPVSLKTVLSSVLTWPVLMADVVAEGPHVVKEIGDTLEVGRYVLIRDFRPGTLLALSSVHGEFEVWWTPEVVSADRVVQFRTAAGDVLSQMHEYDGKIVGAKGETAFIAFVASRPDAQ